MVEAQLAVELELGQVVVADTAFVLAEAALLVVVLVPGYAEVVVVVVVVPLLGLCPTC